MQQGAKRKTRTVYSVIAQYLIPISAWGFGVFHAQGKQLLMPRVGCNKAYPLFRCNRLRRWVGLLAVIWSVSDAGAAPIDLT